MLSAIKQRDREAAFTAALNHVRRPVEAAPPLREP
jgi:hypothetical protein